MSSSSKKAVLTYEQEREQAHKKRLQHYADQEKAARKASRSKGKSLMDEWTQNIKDANARFHGLFPKSDGPWLEYFGVRTAACRNPEIAPLMVNDLQALGIVFFEQFSSLALEHMVRGMQLESCAKRTILFDQGSEGDRMYVIVSGHCTVWAIDDDDTLDFDLRRDDHKAFLRKHGRCVHAMAKGSAFGELALTGAKTRSRTIFCDSACSLLTLDRKLYESVARKAHEEACEKQRDLADQQLQEKLQKRKSGTRGPKPARSFHRRRSISKSDATALQLQSSSNSNALTLPPHRAGHQRNRSTGGAVADLARTVGAIVTIKKGFVRAKKKHDKAKVEQVRNERRKTLEAFAAKLKAKKSRQKSVRFDRKSLHKDRD